MWRMLVCTVTVAKSHRPEMSGGIRRVFLLAEPVRDASGCNGAGIPDDPKIHGVPQGHGSRSD